MEGDNDFLVLGDKNDEFSNKMPLKGSFRDDQDRDEDLGFTTDDEVCSNNNNNLPTTTSSVSSFEE